MSLFSVFDKAPVYHQAFEPGAGESRSKRRRTSTAGDEGGIEGVVAILYQDNVPLQSKYMMVHHGTVLDRHDVRLLGVGVGAPHESRDAGLREPRLNHERFKDLQYDLEKQRDAEEDEKAKNTGYARIPFNYGSSSSSAVKKSEPGVKQVQEAEQKVAASAKVAAQENSYQPDWELPPGHGMRLPGSASKDAVIVKTAKFALQKPELLPKLMGEARLCFLRQGDPLNPYYQWISERLRGECLVLRPTLRFAKEIEEQVDTLKMLAMYGSSTAPSEVERVMKILVAYVEQYGKPFEAHICQLLDAQDQRFAFLDPNHELNKQYMALLGESVEEADDELKQKRQALAKLLMKTM